MQLGVISINYKNTTQDIRDHVAFTDTKKMELLEKLYRNQIEQSLVLSTCNRSELYFLYESESQIMNAKTCYCKMFPQLDLETSLIVFCEKEAMQYLFQTAAGLQSMVLGEDQILGQLQEAIDFSRTMGFSKKVLNKIIRDAVTCAKKLKTTLKISEHPLSVSYIGIKQLQHDAGFDGKSVFVLGSGKMATLALRYILEYGAKEIYVCSRTLSHAKALMEEFPQIHLCTYENRYIVMRGCDIVISATSAPHVVIKKEEFEHDVEVYLLDLASPRDIDPLIQSDKTVHLYNIDSLQKVANENMKRREELVDRGNEMIEEFICDTQEWMLSAKMDATIESLQIRCQEIVNDSFDYINRKLELDHHEKKVIQNTLHASLQRLLREPIHTLKEVEDESEQQIYQEVTEKLFHL